MKKLLSIILLVILVITVMSFPAAAEEYEFGIKAGKKGWLSLIPFLNGYTEYSVCWVGWIGIIPVLTNLFYIIFTPLMSDYYVISTIVVLIGYLIAIPECYKLAKAFGKGKVFGILMAFPVVREVLKLVIGVSGAKYNKS